MPNYSSEYRSSLMSQELPEVVISYSLPSTPPVPQQSPPTGVRPRINHFSFTRRSLEIVRKSSLNLLTYKEFCSLVRSLSRNRDSQHETCNYYFNNIKSKLIYSEPWHSKVLQQLLKHLLLSSTYYTFLSPKETTHISRL